VSLVLPIEFPIVEDTLGQQFKVHVTKFSGLSTPEEYSIGSRNERFDIHLLWEWTSVSRNVSIRRWEFNDTPGIRMLVHLHITIHRSRCGHTYLLSLTNWFTI